MATHSSILAWKIPWTEEPGRLQTMGLQSQTWTEPLHFILLFKNSLHLRLYEILATAKFNEENWI